MSSPQLKALAQEILDTRELYQEKGKYDLRKPYQRLPGQILIINKQEFKGTVASAITKLQDGSDKAEKALEEIWEEFSSIVLAQEQKLISAGSTKLSKERAQELFEIKPRPKGGEIVVVISSFESFQSGYVRKRQRKIVEAVLKKYFPKAKIKQEEINAVSGAGGKVGANLGHGAGQVPTSGIRAMYATSKAIKGLKRGGSFKDYKKVLKIQRNYEKSMKLSIKHSQVLDIDGQFQKGFAPILTWQSRTENADEIAAETEAIENYFEAWKEVLTQEGSTSLLDGVSQVLLYNTAGKSRRNKKVTGKKKRKIKEQNTGNAKKKERIKQEFSVVRTSGVSTALKKLDKSRAQRSSANSSMFALLALLNQKLPNTVRKNMGAPALTNVTGTFANSVKVTDISTTAKGYPSIGYTYAKNPYQVYEIGVGKAPWANTERDPRRLIDRSIREIAAEMAIGRFYTRRV